MKLIIFLVTLIIFNIAYADSLSSIQKDKLIAEKEKIAANLLKDPESAKFRNISVSELMSEPIVCGEMDGKNSYGAYPGYALFYVNGQLAKIKVSPGEWETFCGPITF